MESPEQIIRRLQRGPRQRGAAIARLDSTISSLHGILKDEDGLWEALHGKTGPVIWSSRSET